MRKLAFVLVLLSMLLPSMALASPDRVHGSWRLVAFKDGKKRTPMPKGMDMVLTFDKKKKTWRVNIKTRGQKHESSGKWSMERNVLTMEYKGRKTQMIATPGPDTLTLGLRNRPSRRYIGIRTVK